MNTNVWYEYKKMKSGWPIGTEIKLVLDPIEDYYELLWAANLCGAVIGYNIHKSLVIVMFDNGITMHVAPKMLEKLLTLRDFEF